MEQLSQYVGQSFSINAFGILLVLVALETILSADNAVALAALVQHLEDPQQQRQALNFGLVGAFILRIALLLTATWVINFWQFELLGALYLLWLSAKYFWERLFINEGDTDTNDSGRKEFNTLWQVVPLIALTDLAFSLDSVTTAVAVSSNTWLVITGCVIGIIALRFLTGLFVKWLAEFTYLQDAAYLTVLAVGIRLLCKALLPDYVPPEWVVVVLMSVLFIWGFSKRVALSPCED